MPRRPKPPGKSNWTWREINAGYKMSHGQRSAHHRWEEISKGGPVFTWFMAIAFIVLCIAIWVAGGMKL
jgi:hypothetical protein